jgi:hypothetical protein
MGRGRSRKLGGSVGVGYESTDDLHDGFSEGTVEGIDGGGLACVKKWGGVVVLFLRDRLSEVLAVYSVAIFRHGGVHVPKRATFSETHEFYSVIRPYLHSTKTHCRHSALPISRLKLNMDLQQ